MGFGPVRWRRQGRPDLAWAGLSSPWRPKGKQVGHGQREMRASGHLVLEAEDGTVVDDAGDVGRDSSG